MWLCLTCRHLQLHRHDMVMCLYSLTVIAFHRFTFRLIFKCQRCWTELDSYGFCSFIATRVHQCFNVPASLLLLLLLLVQHKIHFRHKWVFLSPSHCISVVPDVSWFMPSSFQFWERTKIKRFPPSPILHTPFCYPSFIIFMSESVVSYFAYLESPLQYSLNSLWQID